LQRQAEDLRARFEQVFWCEEIGTYALALDGAKRPCKVRTSNVGHALAMGIADADRARRVAGCLMDTRFYSGWGVRTVALDEVRYNPMSYHNGSIWPHDNAFIAQGLARYGHKAGIHQIFDGLVRATTYMDHRRIPELYCGFRRRPGRGPTLYPAACSPQAWAAGAPFSMLQTMLGLEFDHATRRILLINPSPPASAGRIVVRNLTLGDASIDFALSQEGNAVSVQVLRTRGDLQISLLFDANAGRQLVID
jgi:glycogen debranching enzyme